MKALPANDSRWNMADFLCSVPSCAKLLRGPVILNCGCCVCAECRPPAGAACARCGAISVTEPKSCTKVCFVHFCFRAAAHITACQCTLTVAILSLNTQIYNPGGRCIGCSQCAHELMAVHHKSRCSPQVETVLCFYCEVVLYSHLQLKDLLEELFPGEKADSYAAAEEGAVPTSEAGALRAKRKAVDAVKRPENISAQPRPAVAAAAAEGGGEEARAAASASPGRECASAVSHVEVNEHF